MKLTNSFSLSLLGLVALATMFLAKGLDTSGAIVTLCLGYIGARQAKKASDIIAIAKDPAADTLKALKDQEGE